MRNEGYSEDFRYIRVLKDLTFESNVRNEYRNAGEIRRGSGKETGFPQETGVAQDKIAERLQDESGCRSAKR